MGARPSIGTDLIALRAPRPAQSRPLFLVARCRPHHNPLQLPRCTPVHPLPISRALPLSRAASTSTIRTNPHAQRRPLSLVEANRIMFLPMAPPLRVQSPRGSRRVTVEHIHKMSHDQGTTPPRADPLLRQERSSVEERPSTRKRVTGIWARP